MYKEPFVRMQLGLTKDHMKFTKHEAKKRCISQAHFIRALVDKEMNVTPQTSGGFV